MLGPAPKNPQEPVRLDDYRQLPPVLHGRLDLYAQEAPSAEDLPDIEMSALGFWITTITVALLVVMTVVLVAGGLRA